MKGQSQYRTSSVLPPTSMVVQSSILQRKCASCNTRTIAGGKCEDCQNKQGVLQRKSSNNAEFSEVPPVVHEVLNSSGQPLDESAKAFFEPRFGHDFSQVRVHTDSKAAQSAQAVVAAAYTVGNNVVFGAGQYAPYASGGQRLIAHELTHVIQQAGSGSNAGTVNTIVNPRDKTEVEAELKASEIIDNPAAFGKTGFGSEISKTRNTAVNRQVPESMFKWLPKSDMLLNSMYGHVINNSDKDVFVWNSDRKVIFTIKAHSKSGYLEDIDHILEIVNKKMQWYKIGPNTVTVDKDGIVRGYQCPTRTYGVGCDHISCCR